MLAPNCSPRFLARSLGPEHTDKVNFLCINLNRKYEEIFEKRSKQTSKWRIIFRAGCSNSVQISWSVLSLVLWWSTINKIIRWIDYRSLKPKNVMILYRSFEKKYCATIITFATALWHREDKLKISYYLANKFNDTLRSVLLFWIWIKN